MTKKNAVYFICLNFIFILFLRCEAVGTIFHGPKPEEEKPIYTITFDANGATGIVPPEQTVKEGSTTLLPSEGSLSFSGKVFLGWCVSPSGTGATYTVGYSLAVTTNQTLYARWVNEGDIQRYTVTFNANGAIGGTPPAPQTVYDGLSITIPNQGTLTGSGKNFTGWNTAADGSGKNYLADEILIVTANLTLYAQWINPNLKTYTVTYNANGASGAVPAGQTVSEGTTITAATIGSLTNSGKTFSGWNTKADGTGSSYEAGATLSVYTNITLYAQWSAALSDDMSLEQSLAWLNSNAENGRSYTILLRQNESTYGMNLAYGGKTVNLTLRGLGEERTVTLSSDTTLFTVGRGVTLTLDEKVTLKGTGANTTARLIEVQGGALIMNDGSKVSDNAGGGILVNASAGTVVAGKFTMNGGEISGHAITGTGANVYRGAGVYIINGTFSMHGGSIKNNTAKYDGGGVSLYSEAGACSFIMDGGTISGNTAQNGSGIKVYITNHPASVNLSGTAVIKNNTATSSGGGVDISGYGNRSLVSLTMDGGEISGNTSIEGGGVSVFQSRFTMNSGTIKENTAKPIGLAGGGGGVSLGHASSFTMNGGEISGNRAIDGSYGGGILVSGSTNFATFVKSNTGNAVVYGSNESVDLANTTTNGYGDAVYVSSRKKRNTTARAFDSLDSTKDGAEGGWE